MVEIIITSTILILILILFRKLCWEKISRRLQYGLWLLVVIRLLIPTQFFTSSLSIMKLMEYVQETVYEKWQELAYVGFSDRPLMTHYRHLDHIWTLVRSLCLVLYWFHPLVWVAARLSMEDSELACDEGTFIRLGEEKREAYGRTLIEMTTDRTKRTRLIYCATGMINGKKEIKRRITAIAFYQKPVVWIAVLAVVLAVFLSACTAGADKQDAMEETNEQGISLQLASDVVMNADGSFRFSEYEVDLTGDKVKERIVFDVIYWTDLVAEGKTITKQILWDALWNQSEICVKIIEGKEVAQDGEEKILQEYSFSAAHAGNGNLAVVRHEGKNCILRYINEVYQGRGDLKYELWQIMPSGEEPVLIEEMSAPYQMVESGENNQETIEQVLHVGEKLDSFLKSYNTEILLNASLEKSACYLYGSEEGLLNGVRRQNVFQVFMTEVEGTGLELKLADYFYPNGSDLLTVLPEDAEVRVLAGEILYMEVSKDHTTAGRLDLDGDGEKEVLYLEALGGFMNDDGWGRYNRIDSDYRVRVNDQYYENYGDNVDPVLMAFSPDGRHILLAIYDDGPSADPETVFFRYDETGVLPAGSMPADLRLATIDEDGLIKCTFRADMLQTEWAWGYYYWNGGEIVLRDDDIYYFVDDSKWREEYQVPLVLLREITVFAERSEDSEAITMKPQKVRNVATDNSEWILLEAEDGTSGWIRIVQFCFPSEESDPFELFEGLNMAG